VANTLNHILSPLDIGTIPEGWPVANTLNYNSSLNVANTLHYTIWHFETRSSTLHAQKAHKYMYKNNPLIG